jgi:hypothetical protein
MHTAEPRFRGRVMGVRMLGIYGLPLGLLAAGTLVGRIGFAATATLYAVTGLVLTILIALRWRSDVWVTRDQQSGISDQGSGIRDQGSGSRQSSFSDP